MARLIFQQEGDWVRLLGPNVRPFIDFIKYGIRPSTYRRYEAASRSWMIHWRHLRTVANTARRYYDECDWSALPPEWQMVAAGGETNTAVPEELVETNPFATLFVTDDAPLEVVHAAYKALALLHHPDRGGDAETMAKISEAYTRARELREH